MIHPSGTCSYCASPHRLYVDRQGDDGRCRLVYRHLSDGKRCPGSGQPALECADGAWLAQA